VEAVATDSSQAAESRLPDDEISKQRVRDRESCVERQIERNVAEQMQAPSAHPAQVNVF
jgi:hypothetical protein